MGNPPYALDEGGGPLDHFPPNVVDGLHMPSHSLDDLSFGPPPPTRRVSSLRARLPTSIRNSQKSAFPNMGGVLTWAVQIRNCGGRG